jgi:hypothetical protein
MTRLPALVLTFATCCSLPVFLSEQVVAVHVFAEQPSSASLLSRQ